MKYNAHTIQSFHQAVRRYMDRGFYTSLVLDSASFVTKLRLAAFSRDEELRSLVLASIREGLEGWHPISGPLYAWKILSPRFPDECLDFGSSCDVIDYAPKWLLRKHFNEVYEAAPDIHRIWLLNRLGYDMDPEDGFPSVLTLVRSTARTRNCGKDLPLYEYEDGYFYPSCNDFTGIGNLLAAIVGNGGLAELERYIQFNEHIIASYTCSEQFMESGNEEECAAQLFWEALDKELHMKS